MSLVCQGMEGSQPKIEGLNSDWMVESVPFISGDSFR